ncbi:MAG: addiction module protein [Nevskiales bacterium]
MVLAARLGSARDWPCFGSDRILGIRALLRYPLAMIDAALISKVKTLSVADRLELIGAVWDSLAANEAPVTESEKALLDARLADLTKNPADQSPWSEVQERLRRLLA